MAVMKQATKQLRAAGFETLEVRRGLYGYYVTDARFARQTGTTVRDTPEDAVVDVMMRGAKPEEIKGE